MVNVDTSEADAKHARITVGPFKDEQILISPFLWKTKNTNVTGG
jgi:hypothetical protein